MNDETSAPAPTPIHVTLEAGHRTPKPPRAPPPTPETPGSPVLAASRGPIPPPQLALHSATTKPSPDTTSRPVAHSSPSTPRSAGISAAALTAAASAVDLRPLSASLPPSPPRTPPGGTSLSADPGALEAEGAGTELPRILDLTALRALAAAGTDLSRFPGVQITLGSAPPSAGPEGSFYNGPSARVAPRHTTIDRSVPASDGALFGPDLAARLVTYLASEPLSPWLSPRASPSPPRALLPTVTASEGDADASLDCSKECGSTSTPPVPAAAARFGSPPGMPEAWWGGAPSLRVAAWTALTDDGEGEDAVRTGVEWGVGGAFTIVPERSGATATYAFLPPFGDDDTRVIHALVARTPPRRSARSPAPSPDTMRSPSAAPPCPVAARSRTPSLTLGPPIELVPSWGGSPEWKRKASLDTIPDDAAKTPGPTESMDMDEAMTAVGSNALNLFGLGPPPACDPH